MKINILWTGREQYSLENCIVKIYRNSLLVKSTIVGNYADKNYTVCYQIAANDLWQTTSLKIKSLINGTKGHLELEGDGEGNWKFNGKSDERFKGCIDVDIPLTPFTNTLAIRRLKLSPGQSQEILVLYCDLLDNDIQPVHQKYIRVYDTIYHYENVPNDFEADIQVDDSGLVVDYPMLFERTTLINLP